MIVEIVIGVFYFLCGAIFGSFSNVLIERLPRSMSIVKPASHCMSCDHELKWYDNIPILSYLILRGRCRYCGEKYSSRYFFIELVNAVMYVVMYLRFGFGAASIIFSLLFTIFGAIFFIDLKHYIIPDGLNYSILVLAIFSMIFFKFYINITWAERLYSLCFSLLLLALILLFNKLKKKEYLGFGDIKLIIFIGLLVGIKYQILGLFLGALIAVVVEIIIKHKNHDVIPFGPYLCLGYLISIMVGEYLFNWYFSFF